MTNLQAIDLLKGLEQSLDDYCELNDEGKTAFRMAITALEVFGLSEQLPAAQQEQRWIPCGKCIHADGKHRWCKVLDRSINEDYFCYWAEPFRGEGEAE